MKKSLENQGFDLKENSSWQEGALNSRFGRIYFSGGMMVNFQKWRIFAPYYPPEKLATPQYILYYSYKFSWMSYVYHK